MGEKLDVPKSINTESLYIIITEKFGIVRLTLESITKDVSKIEAFEKRMIAAKKKFPSLKQKTI